MTRIVKSLVVLIGVVGLAGGALWGAPPAAIGATPRATPEQVDAAIKKGVDYLYSRQDKDGTWESSDQWSKPPYFQEGGITALATYALLAAGESPQDERLQKAIDWLLAAEMHGTYAVALRANVFNLIPKTPAVKKGIGRDCALLLGGHGPRGFYTYGMGADGDHSNSQYGVLGVWACEEVMEIPSDYWDLVDKGWKAEQYDDGGWSYGGKAPAGIESATMTAAGIATLFITQDYLFGQTAIECKGNLSNVNIERGLKWMSKNFEKVFGGYVGYGLYGVERVGVASGYKYFGNVNWYEEGAAYLINGAGRQAPTGAWGGAFGLAESCFPILFLVRGRAPVAMNKLSYDIDTNGDKPIIGNWNQRPRDVANFAKWMGKQLEKDLNWQIVSLKADVDEFHDAPILYLSGNQTLNFSDEDLAKLKQFVEEGGMILGNADCDSDSFAKSFKGLGKKLFPAYEFRAIKPSHPIYHETFRNEAGSEKKQAWKPLELVGLSNNARELMVLIPKGDPAKFWQTRSYKDNRVMHELIGNLFLYAAGKSSNLRVKGKTYLVHADPKITPAVTVKVARLKYSANWNPEPAGWRRLANVVHNDLSMKLAVEDVELGGDKKLDGFAVAHLTGTDKFTLSEAEHNRLRKFVAGGGTLLVDSCGGGGDFTAAAQAELKATWPGNPLKELKKTSPVLQENGKELAIRYREFGRSGSAGRRARLKGIEIGDRTAVFFSEDDLSVGLVGQSIDGIYGYEPEVATKLVENIVKYAAAELLPKPAAQPTSAPATAPASTVPVAGAGKK
ncbi:MAG TPA: DUF4159 domain-containing protein [Tepidisphaeraceae bacterium]|jgi:hypothetical protein